MEPTCLVGCTSGHNQHLQLHVPSTTTNILISNTHTIHTTIHIPHIHNWGGCGWKVVGMVATW